MDIVTYLRARASLADPLETVHIKIGLISVMDAADEIERLRSALECVYNERNRVVALLARHYPSGVMKTDIPGWDEDWHNCVYIDLPTGQASWHYHDSEAHLFAHLPAYKGEFDGHTTEEKYERVARAALGEEK